MIESTGFRWARAISLTLIAAFVLIPVYIVLSTSIKPLGDVFGSFQWFPSAPTLEPYLEIWRTVPLGRYLLNSLIVSTIATVFSLLIAILAGYAVARLAFRGVRVFRMIVLATQMFPGILFLLPLFLLYTQINNLTGVQLNGSLLGLIITYVTFTLPVSIWMLSGFFASIPPDLEEAAMIDGTTRVGALFRIVVPVARPAIIAVGVYCFIASWGEVLFASVITTKDTRTLSIGLQQYASQDDVLWNQLMAASVVVSIPVLIGFLLVQKQLMTGLAAGSVK